MAAKPNLAALSSLKSTALEETVYRVIPEKLKDKLLSTEGNRFFPGRYHLAGETGILYSSLKEEVAILEIERRASRHILQGRLAVGKIRIRLRQVLDLTQTSNLVKLGLSKENLISKNYSPTQAISVQARHAGFDGLLVPSAASQGTNLIIFENNLGEGCLIEIESIQAL